MALALAAVSLIGLPASALAGSAETQEAEQRCSDRGLTGQDFDECVAEETGAQQQGAPPEPPPEDVRRAPSQESGSDADGGQTLNQTQSGDGIQQNEQQSDPSGSIVQSAIVNGRRQGRRARRSRCGDLTLRQLERRPRCANQQRRKLPKAIDEDGTPPPVDASQAGIGVTLSIVS